MNRSNLNPFNLRKRLVIIIAVMLAMFAAVGLIACGDNDIPTGGNGNGNDPEPTVLVYSLDSLIAQTPPNAILNFNDTALFTAGRVKVTFDLVTNCDTNEITFVELIIRNNDSTFLGVNYSPVVNNSYTHYINVVSGSAEIKFRIRLTSALPRFLKLKNFKVYN